MEGDTQRLQTAWKGAKYGMVSGVAIGQAVIANNSPLGFYAGSVVLVLGFWIAVGAAVGAGIGWLIAGEA